MKKHIASIVSGVDMSGNLPVIITPNLPDMFTGKVGREEDGRGQARQALARAVNSGMNVRRAFIPVATPMGLDRLVPARSGEACLGTARAVYSGEHLLGAHRWQHQYVGLLGRVTERQGGVRQGLFTARS